MAGHGGKREGAGRKPKVDEARLVEMLTPLEPKAYKALEKGINEDKSWAVKLFFEYLYGKPKQSVDVTSGGEKLQQQVISVDPLGDD